MDTKKNKRPREDSESEDSDSSGSLKEFIVKGPIEDSTIIEEVDGDVPIDLLKEEAERFAGQVKGTAIGGRVLRSREPEDLKKRQTKDEYYERFGRAEEAKVLEKFIKKDTIDHLLTLAHDYREAYIAAGNEWPVLNMRMTLEHIQAEYQKVKDFAGLPDSDIEDSESGDESVDDDDAEEDTDDAEDSDDEDDEDDEDEESESADSDASDDDETEESDDD